MTDPFTFQNIMAKLNNKRDWRERAEAVQELADLQTDEAMETITSALYDESPHVVDTASGQLKRFGSRAVPGLLKALEAPNIASRPFLIHALRAIGDAAAVPAIIKILTDQDAGMRYAAALALTEIVDERAYPALLNALKHKELGIQSQAAVALGRLRNPAAIPELVELLSDEDKNARRNAAIAIGKIGGDAGWDALRKAYETESIERIPVLEGLAWLNITEADALLREALHHSDPLVRSAAARSLGRPGNSAAIPHLLELIDDPSPDVQYTLLNGLGYVGDLQALPILASRLRDPDPYHATMGFYLFVLAYWRWEEREEETIPAAISSLENPDYRERMAGVWLLYALSEKREHEHIVSKQQTGSQDRLAPVEDSVMYALIKALGDPHPDVRLSATYPLLRLVDQRAVPALIERLADNDETITARATSLLKTAADSRAVPALMELLKSTNMVLVRHAIAALGAIGGDEARKVLIELANHPDSDRRVSAAIALGYTKDRRAVPVLIDRLMHDTNTGVREFAASALGNVGDSSAIEALGQVLNATDLQGNRAFDLRRAASYALQKIRDEAALPALYAALETPVEDSLLGMYVDAIASLGKERDIVERLFKFLSHSQDAIRQSASTRLGYIGANTPDLDLRDYIVSNLIQRLEDRGHANIHYAVPNVAAAAAKSLYYIGTTEAIEALEQWEQG